MSMGNAFIKEYMMAMRYQGKWSPNTLDDNCWIVARSAPEEAKYK
jgi:hypothetical protein